MSVDGSETQQQSEKKEDSPSDKTSISPELTENKPTTVHPIGEKPAEKPSEEKPIETPTKEKPIESPTEEKPGEKPATEKTVEEKPNGDKLSEEKPNEQKPDNENVHLIADEKPGSAKNEQKPIAEEKPVVKPEPDQNPVTDTKIPVVTSSVSVPQQVDAKPDSETHKEPQKEETTSDVAEKPKTAVAGDDKPKTEVDSGVPKEQKDSGMDNKKGRKMVHDTENLKIGE